MTYILKNKKWNLIYLVDELWEVPQDCWYILKRSGQALLDYCKQHSYSEINRQMAAELVQAGILCRDKVPF